MRFDITFLLVGGVALTLAILVGDVAGICLMGFCTLYFAARLTYRVIDPKAFEKIERQAGDK